MVSAKSSVNLALVASISSVSADPRATVYGIAPSIVAIETLQASVVTVAQDLTTYSIQCATPNMSCQDFYDITQGSATWQFTQSFQDGYGAGMHIRNCAWSGPTSVACGETVIVATGSDTITSVANTATNIPGIPYMTATIPVTAGASILASNAPLSGAPSYFSGSVNWSRIKAASITSSGSAAGSSSTPASSSSPSSKGNSGSSLHVSGLALSSAMVVAIGGLALLL